MDKTNQVFCSDIIRTDYRHRNNLYDLLNIIPAKPLELQIEKKTTCDFVPRTDKIYVPKGRYRAKVRTVRDIRTSFENDTYHYLTNDLKSQQNYLLKRIRDGSSNNEHTQNIAKKMLSSDSPIPRATWQMLVNLNPHRNKHSQQFVLWNGKLIQVNGSKGGENKLIYSYDLGNTKIPLNLKKKFNKNKSSYRKKGLLRNSLSIKFKPGPLGKKKYLDYSHQKYNGDIELVRLPKVGLVFQPTYGTVIEPTIGHFLNNLYKEDGVISEKWAEFSVSVLGKNDKSNAKLLSEDCVTFDFKYRYDQHRILMRKDLDKLDITKKYTKTSEINQTSNSDKIDILPEIKHMMHRMLDAVEINVNQDKMFSENEDCNAKSAKESTDDGIIILKDKMKRKYCELDRLDVTVIHLPHNSGKVSKLSCENAYCTLGCVCDSLTSTCIFKPHCGREECMFNCKCDFAKYSYIKSLENNSSDSTSLLPGIINIEKEINMRLAKEEQKFHQTVFVTEQNNILLKTEKRNLKSSVKYESFNENKYHGQRLLSISTVKLNCENIEPFCMVHNLYKCFCKGKFTSSCVLNVLQNTTKEPNSKIPDPDPNVKVSIEKIQNTNDNDMLFNLLTKSRHHVENNAYRQIKMKADSRNPLDISNISVKKRKTLTVSDILNTRPKRLSSIKQSEIAHNSSDHLYDFYCSDYNGTCSRVIAYEGRKYSEGHYKNINYKIKQMEENDTTLKKKIMSLNKRDVGNIQKDDEKHEENLIECSENLMNPDYNSEKNTSEENIQATGDTPIPETSDDKNFIKFFYDINGTICNQNDKSTKKLLTSEKKLVKWLESHYKIYKKRIEEGAIKAALEPPKIGKVALHSWEFILCRYRERKNLFLISKQTPYRIFMGVHTKNPFFETCMNINEIRFADLYKYPQTVKNLLTNATDLKDNFCILRGLAHCWELVGSVAKVSSSGEDNTETISDDISDTGSNPLSHISDTHDDQMSIITYDDQTSTNTHDDEMSTNTHDDQMTTNTHDDKMSSNIHEDQMSTSVSKDVNNVESTSACATESESSKWFIMTVTNDFIEIRFYNRGFFVKYESIVNAINVARLSGKTVRLSSHKCVDKNNAPQFGIYAIPNTNDYCVFIGPYETSDTLGIETVKLLSYRGKTKGTRGFWMYTNKIDNLKVIDNPMSFIPFSSLKMNTAVPIEHHMLTDNNLKEEVTLETSVLKDCNAKEEKTLQNVEKKKIVKPIKIRKTNGFYHLASNSLLNKMSLQIPHPVILRPTLTINAGTIIQNPDNLLNNINNLENITTHPSDINIEEPPQIKITAVYSQRDEQDFSKNKKESGMFILKPEEINRRLFEDKSKSEATSPQKKLTENAVEISEPQNMECTLFQDLDTETSPIITPCTVNADICVISDDDSEPNNDVNTDENWKKVLILCTDVPDLGWIWGRQKRDPLALSFKVPGGEYTEFYGEDVAFKKLNSVLSKIIGPSKLFDFRWKVIDSLDDLKTELTPLGYERLHEVLDQQTNQRPESPSVSGNNVKTYTRKKIPSSSTSRTCSPVVDSAPTVESPVKEPDQEKEPIDLLNED